MDSVFSWLDSSEDDRRRAMDVIDLLRQKETVDELGLGSVRDTIADFLSPGTSTVQRRARYFFFIPWIYKEINRTIAGTSAITARARQAEINLIDVLASSSDSTGTIGIDARAGLKRLPSMIYWSGLGRLGFRLFPGSQDQYHRLITRRSAVPELDDTGDINLDAGLTRHWHPQLPAAPVGFPKNASFELRKPEATFFLEQLRIHAPDSLMLFLVERRQLVDDVDFPWELPSVAQAPARLRSWLHDGQMYSELMVGAAYLYNLMLAQQLPSEQLTTVYEKALAVWATQMVSHAVIYKAWNRPAFWEKLRRLNPRLPMAAQVFSDQWMTLVLAGDAVNLKSVPAARGLIAERERSLKRSRARLANREQLILWGGASGAAQLDYRWGITKVVVNDIVSALRG